MRYRIWQLDGPSRGGAEVTPVTTTHGVDTDQKPTIVN